ncbi:MAG: tol-pal system protein YbgF [Desulfobacteraceae bacterium]|nr:tol-pal system protein YbgF [Desulfobacteraceae bacterium]
MKSSFLYVIFCLVLVSGCVAPDQVSVLDQRVATLENKLMIKEGDSVEHKDRISLIEKRVQEDISSSQEKYAELKYEIDLLKGNMQRLENVIGELNQKMVNSSDEDSESLEKTIDTLDNAISKNYEKIIILEKYMGFEPSVPKPADSMVSDPEHETGEKTEAQLYSHAKKLLDNGDRENARIQFENFINRFPNSENADNARFWIADSYYADKWYEKAILEYQVVLEAYPTSNKIAAALLKQGYAFAELGEKANARLLLKELIKKHPKSKEATYAKEKLKKLN